MSSFEDLATTSRKRIGFRRNPARHRLVKRREFRFDDAFEVRPRRGRLLCYKRDLSQAIRRLLVVVMLLPAGVLGGCNAASDRTNGGDPLSNAPERELREVFRLGGLEPAEEEAFQQEPPLTVDRDGLCYVLHRNLGRVAVFDPAGAFLGWIGQGEGEGPGEFTFAVTLGLVADTLWLRNLTPPWISRFLSDGTFIDSDRVIVDADYVGTGGVQGVSGYLRGGRAWMVPAGFLMGADADGRAPFILGDRRLERQDTLFIWRAGRGRLAGTAFAPLAEPPFHDIAPDGSGIVLAEWSEHRPDELLIRFFEPDATERWSWSFAIPPRPLPAAVRDSLVVVAREQVAQVRERVIAQGVSEESAPRVPTATEVREQAYLPNYFPPIRAVRLGADGTIWLHRTDGMNAGPWLAVDSDGAPLFQVTLPDGSRFREASRESVWGTEAGAYDIPYVVRWELVAADDL